MDMKNVINKRNIRSFFLCIEMLNVCTFDMKMALVMSSLLYPK
jgi:hypothetical protein